MKNLSDKTTNIEELKKLVKEFCDERDWDQFHNAKYLEISIVTESSELLNHFRFKSEEEVKELFNNKKRREEITEEMADILYVLLRMAQKYNVDLSKELENKIKKNKEKYPIEKSKGLNKKYNEI